MDIFSATNKQLNIAQTQSTSVQNLETRSVEQSQANRSDIKDSKIQNMQDKKEIQKQLNETVKELNEQMEHLETNIAFGFNDKISSMYVSVSDKSSGKLIRKIPTEEAMKLSEHFQEIIGVIFDKKG